MRQTLAATSALVVVIAGWGCQASEGSLEPSSTPSNSERLGESEAASSTTPTTAPVRSAEYQEVGRIPHPLKDGTQWGPIALTERGIVVANLTTDLGTQAALINPRDGTLTRLGDPQPGGVFAADSNSRHLVWVTSEAQDLFTMPWTLYSYDYQTRRVRELAEAPDVGVSPVPAAPDGTRPTLLGRRVFYTAVHKVVRGRPVPAVYSVSVTGGRPRVEVMNAFDGTVTRQGLYFLRSRLGSFTDWSLNLKSGRSIRMIDSGGSKSRISGVAFDRSGAVTWQESIGAECQVYVKRGDAISRVWEKRCRRGWAYYLDITDAFATGSTQPATGGYVPWLVRPGESTGQPFELEDRTVKGIQGGGSYLMWTLDEKDSATVIARLSAS